MLLWPLPTQTSPTSTFSSVTVLEPSMVILYGPPASGVSTATFHLAPLLPVTLMGTELQPTEMLIFSAGSHHPQRVIVALRCSTMLLPKMAGRRISAWASRGRRRERRTSRLSVFTDAIQNRLRPRGDSARIGAGGRPKIESVETRLPRLYLVELEPDPYRFPTQGRQVPAGPFDAAVESGARSRAATFFFGEFRDRKSVV